MTNLNLDELIPIIKRMPAYGRLIHQLYSSANVTTRQKAILGAGLVYAVSPIDLVPGFLPVVGQLDDIVIGLSALDSVLRGLPDELKEEYLIKAGITYQDIERDLTVAKAISRHLAGKAVDYAGQGLRLAGRAAWKAAGYGMALAIGGVASVLGRRS